MTAASLILLLWTALAQGPVPTGGDDLTAAKTLYASGAYEEALARLSALTAAEHGDDVDQYRALCLLALGRAAETESSLQALIVRNPLFKMSEQDMSPRLVSLFHDVRKRVLPSTVKDLYGKAKTNYDQKQYSAASTQFTDLLKLLADEDLEAGAPAFSDLKMLGEGFLKLTQAELAAAEKKVAAADPPPAAAPTPAAPPPATAGAPAAPKIYSISDQDVTPPVDVTRPMPPWRPVNAIQARTEYRGILHVVISEQGRVESATFIDPVETIYDSLLLAATKQWSFRPATRNGEPVRYEREIPVVLLPK